MRTRLGGLLALAVSVAVGLAGWWLTRPAPLPTKEQAAARMAQAIGQRERTAVAAVCEVPTKDGFSCRLRDAAGRYGYAITSFQEESLGDPLYGEQRRRWFASWDFPIDSDGRLTSDFDTAPPWDLPTRLTGILLLAGRAVGPVVALPPPGCPPAQVGQQVSCTVTGGAVRAATVRRTGATAYRLSAEFVLPDPASLPPPR
jgi:hypothetical protein